MDCIFVSNCQTKKIKSDENTKEREIWKRDPPFYNLSEQASPEINRFFLIGCLTDQREKWEEINRISRLFWNRELRFYHKH